MKSSQGGGCCRTHGGGLHRKKKVPKFVVLPEDVPVPFANAPRQQQTAPTTTPSKVTMPRVKVEPIETKTCSNASTTDGLETPRGEFGLVDATRSVHPVEKYFKEAWASKQKARVAKAAALVEVAKATTATDKKTKKKPHQCSVGGCHNAVMDSQSNLCSEHGTNLALATFLLEMKAATGEEEGEV